MGDRILAMSGAGAEKSDGEGADKPNRGEPSSGKPFAQMGEEREVYVRGRHTGRHPSPRSSATALTDRYYVAVIRHHC